MYKLNAFNPDGTVKFEQVFSNYVIMREKEKELIKEGYTTIITPMSKDDHNKYSEELLKKVIGLYGNSVLN